MIEILEGIPASRPNLIRVRDLVYDWKLGDTYTAFIVVTLVKKEQNGMILELLDFKPAEKTGPINSSGFIREDRTEMKVVPSPS